MANGQMRSQPGTDCLCQTEQQSQFPHHMPTYGKEQQGGQVAGQIQDFGDARSAGQVISQQRHDCHDEKASGAWAEKTIIEANRETQGEGKPAKGEALPGIFIADCGRKQEIHREQDQQQGNYLIQQSIRKILHQEGTAQRTQKSSGDERPQVFMQNIAVEGKMDACRKCAEAALQLVGCQRLHRWQARPQQRWQRQQATTSGDSIHQSRYSGNSHEEKQQFGSDGFHSAFVRQCVDFLRQATDPIMSKAVKLQQLKKTYANGTEALKGIDLEVERGDFFALLGPNGAGKSTAIGILCSLVRKTSGKVAVFGADLDVEPERVKSQIGLVPQEFNFNQFEPVEEIVINQAGFYGISRKQAYARARSVLKTLDLWGKRRAQARSLSGGMKRRLMIARALAHEPRLMILDEPTAGVDIEIRRSMWSFMQEINRAGTTIILTTHYLEEAENLCRNIAIIDCGHIVEHSSMKELLHRLHRQAFILSLRDALKTLPEDMPFGLKAVDEHSLEAVLEQDQSLNQLFDWLNAQGIEVLSMRNKQNRLEQFFMDRVRQRQNRADL